MSIFAFHHIGLCKSSHLCVKLSPSSMPCLGNMQLSPIRQAMSGRGSFLPGSRQSWGWCLCLLGGTGLLNVPVLHPVCNYKSSDLNNVLVCPWVLYLLFKTTLLVLLTGGVVEYLTQFSGQVLFSSPKGISSSRPTGSQTLEHLGVWLLPLREPQDPACPTLFDVLCVLLNKFYCFSFRTRIGKPASSLDKL